MILSRLSLRSSLTSIIVLQLVICFSQVATYRPDNVWAVGSNQTTFDCFGMNQIRFDGASVEVYDLDSVGIQTFSSANVQYHHPDFSLYANSYSLSRGFSDSLLSLLNYDTDPFRREEGRRGTFGAQGVLPVSNSGIVYIGETLFIGDFSTSVWFVMPGISSAFLSVDSLRDSLTSDVQMRTSFFTDTGDSLVRRVFEHVSNPSGGWWGIARSSVSNRFQKWQVKEDTILLDDPQELGQRGEYDEGSAIDLTFRPSGDAFAISGSDHGLDLYYFDRTTGVISIWDEIGTSYDPDFEPYTVATRCEWSADGRYLYVTTEADLFQFDTEATDIAASAVQINDPENIPFRGTYRQIERGPDCRLYVGRAGTGKTLSVIDKPSRPGDACELKDSGLLLPNYYFSGIPEFPEYSLWARDRVARGLAPIIDTAVCDSSIRAYNYFDWTTSATEVFSEVEGVVVSPNPAIAGEVITLNYDLPSSLVSDLTSKLTVSLFSISGQQVGELELLSIDAYDAKIQLPSNVTKGMYRLLITSERRPLLEGKVLVRQ